MKIVIVTSCMAGVAQSRMAALALKKEAEGRGMQVVFEEQGGHKISNRLSREEIEAADVVIIARAISISGKERFAGKKVFEIPVNIALMDPRGTIDRAIDLVKQ